MKAPMPHTKLTKTVVEQIPFTDKGQLRFNDSELSGFHLIVGMKAKTYAVQRDIAGKSVRVTIGRHGVYTAEQARKEAAKHLFFMSQGINPNEEKKREQTKGMTLEELAEDFFNARSNLRERTQTDYRYNLTKYLADWLKKPVADLTEDMVRRRYTHFGKNHGKTVANNVRRILSSILNYGIAAYKILERNPVRIIAETKSGYPIKRRRTYIKPHQLPAWWEAVEDEETDTSRDYLLLVLFTGLRRSEACRLKWSDIDLIGKTLSLEDSKNGEPLTLPLSRFLLNLLENRHRRYGNYEYVFPGDGEHGHYIEPKKSVYRVGKRSGIHFTIHDLRRTFITIAESLDISAYALKRLINHKITNDITGGYIIVDVERLREPVEKIAQTILGYKDGEEAGSYI